MVTRCLTCVTVPVAAAAGVRALARDVPRGALAARPQRRRERHAAGSVTARLQSLLLLRSTECTCRTGKYLPTCRH